MLLRQGGLEFTQMQFASLPPGGGARGLDLSDLEGDVLTAVEVAKELSGEGLLTIPLVLSLRLLDVRGLSIRPGPQRRLESRTAEIDDVAIEPVLVRDWEEISGALRSIFHVLWQAFGYSRSPS
jgi:hypothetical protein